MGNEISESDREHKNIGLTNKQICNSIYGFAVRLSKCEKRLADLERKYLNHL